MSGALSAPWREALGSELEAPYMHDLREFLRNEKAAGKIIYPPGTEIFNAFNATAPHEVKVVILGQDPYHGPNQAHGLCFSVRAGVKVPPSLVNIFKEIEADLGIAPPEHGDLTAWANQGVLLLNATLTVEQAKAGAHQNRGWETFTDAAVAYLNQRCEHIVFLLWGSYAQKKGALVDRSRHCVLAAPHPSPLSAHRGFFGCRHFSKANQYLVRNGRLPVDWSLPS